MPIDMRSRFLDLVLTFSDTSENSESCCHTRQVHIRILMRQLSVNLKTALEMLAGFVNPLLKIQPPQICQNQCHARMPCQIDTGRDIAAVI
jgi:hypothetical protein